MLIAHQGLSQACLIFTGLVGIWSLYEGARGGGPSGSLMGSVVICEALLIGQGLVGTALLGNQEWQLSRSYLHILYGIVAVISLPAAYAYFSRLRNPRAMSFGLAFTSGFIFLCLLRAVEVAA